MEYCREPNAPLRVRYMSDLHLELSDYRPPELHADVVLLAGDIHTGTNGLEWAARTFPNTTVLYLPGNHEYYEQDLLSLYPELEATAARLGIHFLDNKEVVIGNVRFLGSSLWTDFDLKGAREYAMQAATDGMNDYRQIRHGNRTLLPSCKPPLGLDTHS